MVGNFSLSSFKESLWVALYSCAVILHSVSLVHEVVFPVCTTSMSVGSCCISNIQYKTFPSLHIHMLASVLIHWASISKTYYLFFTCHSMWRIPLLSSVVWTLLESSSSLLVLVLSDSSILECFDCGFSLSTSPATFLPELLLKRHRYQADCYPTCTVFYKMHTKTMIIAPGRSSISDDHTVNTSDQI